MTARPYSAALRAESSHNCLLINGERRPTERERLRIQGFPEDYRLAGKYRQARRRTGDAAAIPATAAALRSVNNALEQLTEQGAATPSRERDKAPGRRAGRGSRGVGSLGRYHRHCGETLREMLATG